MDTLILNQNVQPTPSAATVGMFDGVHRGHRFVTATLRNYAESRGLASVVVTFDRPPRSVLQEDWRPQLLTTYEERLSLLAETGIDRCVVVPFTRETARLSARDFMLLLRQRLGVQALLTGYDNRFGHDRRETFDDYLRYGRECGMEVGRLPQAPAAEGMPTVSSSLVRRLLAEGDVSQAARCLTRPYQLTGRVVRGEHIGTSLGYPTANILPNDPYKIIPAAGVYAVQADIALPPDHQSAPSAILQSTASYRGMMNIGTRPTFGNHPQTLEVHLLDYDGDLYGQAVTVRFLRRLREERRFDSREALVEQLRHDAAAARNT